MATIRQTIASLSENRTYVMRVRAIDPLGRKSEWSDSIVVSLAADGETDPGDPPAVPTGGTGAAGIRKIVLTWDAPPVGTTLKYWEIHVSNNPLGAPSANNLLAQSYDTIQSIDQYFDDSGATPGWKKLEAGATYYIWLVAVSYTGIKSPPSAVIVATTGFLENSDLQAGTITADRITSSTLLADLIVGGTIRSAVGQDGFQTIFDADGIRLTNGLVTNVEIKNDGSARFSGKIEGGTIDIGGSDTSSFHVNSGGDVWLGAGTFSAASWRVTAEGSMRIGGSDGTSFHVRKDGAVWSGATLFEDAPFRVSSNGQVDIKSGSIDIGTSGNSFHVNPSGQMWFGANTYENAPFRISDAGAVRIQGGGTFTVGEVVSGRINAHIYQSTDGSSSFAAFAFRNGTTDRAFIYYSPSNEMIIGGLINAPSSILIGNNILEPDNNVYEIKNSGNRHSWRANGQTILQLHMPLGSVHARIWFNKLVTPETTMANKRVLVVDTLTGEVCSVDAGLI